MVDTGRKCSKSLPRVALLEAQYRAMQLQNFPPPTLEWGCRKADLSARRRPRALNCRHRHLEMTTSTFGPHPHGYYVIVPVCRLIPTLPREKLRIWYWLLDILSCVCKTAFHWLSEPGSGCFFSAPFLHLVNHCLASNTKKRSKQSPLVWSGVVPSRNFTYARLFGVTLSFLAEPRVTLKILFGPP